VYIHVLLTHIVLSSISGISQNEPSPASLAFYLTPAIVASINIPSQQRGIHFAFQLALSNQTVHSVEKLQPKLELFFFC